MRSFGWMMVLVMFVSCGSSGDDDKPAKNPGKSYGVTWPVFKGDSIIRGEYIVSVTTAFAQRYLHPVHTGKNKIPSEKAKLSREEIWDRYLQGRLKQKGLIAKVIHVSSYGFTFKGDSSVVQALLADPDIVAIIPNFYRTIRIPAPVQFVPPQQQLPWGVQRVSSSTKKDGVYNAVWIIDTGIDTSHTDLNVDMKESRSFVPGDTTVYDYLGHGTHIAGIIGARADNNIGVIGVAPNAPIRALKIYDRQGRVNFSESYIPALEWVSARGKAGEVLNLSCSGFGRNDDEVRLINEIAAKGIRVVIAAGNCDVNFDQKPADVAAYIDPHTGKVGVYPANLNGPNIYTVSAYDSLGAYSGCSNYGLSVDVSAPGENILSTLPGNTWGVLSGTSMAAPHVAGLLLLTSVLNTAGPVRNDPDGHPDPMAHE